MRFLYRLPMAALLVVWLAVVAIVGCGPSPNQNSNSTASPGRTAGQRRIVTTVGMVADIVRQVIGDKGEVLGLLGEGVDPHLYKPTRNDVQKLIDADVVIYCGLYLEGRMQETFERISQGSKPVYAVTDGLPENYVRHPAEFAGHPDPHVWMDVGAWSHCVAGVAKRMAEIDPSNAEYYQANAKEYRGQLERLDAYIREGVSTVPEEKRVLITVHDAFGYFGRAYQIDVRAPQGISTESEASVDDINGLASFIAQRKIEAIFIESSVNPKSIQAVLEGVSAQGHSVRIGGELYSDAMGAAGSYEGTYVGMMDHNATTIVRGLGGKAPPGGFQGKLTKEENP